MEGELNIGGDPAYRDPIPRARPVEDVPLPGDELPRRQRSRCPWHAGQCAYTGDEPDRCPICHALWTSYDDEYDEHAEHIAKRMVADLEPELRLRLRAAAYKAKHSSKR